MSKIVNHLLPIAFGSVFIITTVYDDGYNDLPIDGQIFLTVTSLVFILGGLYIFKNHEKIVAQNESYLEKMSQRPGFSFLRKQIEYNKKSTIQPSTQTAGLLGFVIGIVILLKIYTDLF